MPVVLDHEKVFDIYPSILPELRMMVIDEMEPEDRWRFTRCSRLSRKEARASKNFLKTLEINISLEEIEIFVRFKEYRGFSMKFVNESGNLIMRYLSNRNQLWVDTFYDIPDWVQFAIRHFNNLLQMYRNTVKNLRLYGPDIKLLLNGNDFELKHSNRLEQLWIGDIDPSSFFTKLRLPLKILFSCQDHEGFKTSEQLYSVSNAVIMKCLRLNNEQFLRLSASRIQIHIGELTAQNIANFIGSWKNGTLRDNFQRCQWDLENSNFNKDALFRAFGVDVKDQLEVQTTIKHEKEAWKRANLIYFETPFMRLLRFEVNINEQHQLRR